MVEATQAIKGGKTADPQQAIINEYLAKNPAEAGSDSTYRTARAWMEKTVFEGMKACISDQFLTERAGPDSRVEMKPSSSGKRAFEIRCKAIDNGIGKEMCDRLTDEAIQKVAGRKLSQEEMMNLGPKGLARLFPEEFAELGITELAKKFVSDVKEEYLKLALPIVLGLVTDESLLEMHRISSSKLGVPYIEVDSAVSGLVSQMSEDYSLAGQKPATA